MLKFDFDITYVKGEYNKVANCLSHYYESDTPADKHKYHDYIHADRKLDLDRDDPPQNRVTEIMERVMEIHAMRATKEKHDQQLRDIKGC